MKKGLLVLLVAMLVILTSCSNPLPNNKGSENIAKEENKKPMSPKSSVTTEEPSKAPKYTDKDIEKIFLPPNFVVKKFDIAHKKRKIEFAMNYSFNEKLYSILKTGVSFSFMIIYPEPVQQILNKKSSNIFPGKVNSEGQLNYSISFAEELESDIDEDQYKEIKDNMEYQLYVLNSKEEVFQIFPTFRYMIDYEEGKSDVLFYD